VKNHLSHVTDEFLQHPKVIWARPSLMAIQQPHALTGWRLIFRGQLPHHQRNFNFDHFTYRWHLLSLAKWLSPDSDRSIASILSSSLPGNLEGSALLIPAAGHDPEPLPPNSHP
jgi:hypothetical protein